MPVNSLTPVIVGVGDIKNASTRLEDATEPMQLMLQAINAALKDTSLSNTSELQSQIDSVDVVATWTWPYPDLPGLLADNLAIKPRRTTYSSHGGNQPAKLLDEAARRISLGTTKVAIVTGGEALASLTACAAAKKVPPPGWTPLPEGQTMEGAFSPTTRKLAESVAARHAIGAPIHVYPLYENGFRAHRGQSLHANHEESAELYAQFAEVAAQNPHAWSHGKPALGAKEIGTLSKKNRMICLPYPLLMNAFNTVNLAAAVLMTSAGNATRLGVPQSKWIYPLGGAGTSDAGEFWLRPDYHSSPALSRSLDAALDLSGLEVKDLDIVDFYSCFPIVPKLAAEHLGWNCTSAPCPLTVLGGLTSFGGAGNNYSMHAITTIVRQLRDGKGQNALVLANGGVLTYQHVVCLSSRPRRSGTSYPTGAPLTELWDSPYPPLEEEADGEAVVETYTVEFERDGKPKKAFVVGKLTGSGKRFLANHADEASLGTLASTEKEPIGRKGWVSCDKSKRRNVFKFTGGVNL